MGTTGKVLAKVIMVSAAVSSSAGLAASEALADLILTNGEVYARDGWAEAVAVRDSTIVAVGSVAEVDALRGEKTEVVDLAGAPLFPGLIDAHAHPVFGAMERLGGRVSRDDWAEALKAIEACATAAPAGEWIVAGPVDAEVLPSVPNPRAILDIAAPNNPTFVHVVGGHALMVNSRTLDAARIDRSTPNPPGGEIGRDSAGEPTGLLLDVNTIWVALPPPDAGTVAPATAEVLSEFLALGITSITEANASPLHLEVYALLADEGRSIPRMRTCLTWAPPMPHEAVPAAAVFARERIATDCVKIFVDGESYTGRTAALLEPYQPADGSETEERGALMLTPTDLQEAVTAFDRAGLTVKFHVWGDAAVDAALTAVEHARAQNGPDGPKHQLGHVLLARHDDLARAANSNVVLEFSPSGWVPMAMPALGKDIGESRMARAWPVADTLNQGAQAIGGSDWPAGPPGAFTLWKGIETLVTRLEPGETAGTPLAPGQRISLQQAIGVFTANAATMSEANDAPGIIEPGRKADLIVLDRNPFEIPITEVHRIKTEMTIVDGEIVYQAAKGD